MPRMRMHTYDLNNIMQIINKSGVSETMQTTTDHGGYIGVMIIGKKIVPPSKWTRFFYKYNSVLSYSFSLKQGC